MASVEEQPKNSPRLGQAQTDDLVRRLYDNQMERSSKRDEERRRQLEKSRFVPKHISKDEEGELVKRIYDQQLQRFQANKEERERAAYEDAHRHDKKMVESDIQEQVDRIYNQEIARAKARREELMKRYLPEGETKKISKTELKESVERLHHVDYAKRDEELFKKHVYPYDPPSRKINRSDEEAMANRLSTRNNA